jgi:radical SAM superfamily enzyme YgiQ (UPF0313 family)
MTMRKRLYLINPPSDFPTHYGGEAFSAAQTSPACLVADLATVTVAAMAAPFLDVQICEASVSPVDYDTPADYIGLTGKLTQVDQMLRISRTFRARGKTVLIGGPFASLSPEAVRGHCDILIRGEMEAISDELFAALRDDTWKAEYDGGQPDISSSPVPRWDLYPNDRALVGALQTSRGCPFECEFCDVIQYLGRKQRFKSIPQILAELEVLHRHGYRRIFLCDDNFTVAKKRAKQVLSALQEWNERRPVMERCTFDTQASIEAAENDDLLQACADAGLTSMFIGIETPNEDSLRETKKHQNLRRPILSSIEKFVQNGIALRGGMIVGFDADGPDMFQRMYDFAMETPIPFWNLGALVAPSATTLYHRLKSEGRIISGAHDVAAMPMDTNIVPKLMSREELLRGVRWLGNQLYRPAAFLHRIRSFVKHFAICRQAAPAPSVGYQMGRTIYRDAIKVIKNVRSLGPDEEAMCREVFNSLLTNSAANSAIMESLLCYAQVRHLYSKGRYWDEHLPEHYDPPAAVSLSVGGVPV